jgi:hypothetical protein
LPCAHGSRPLIHVCGEEQRHPRESCDPVDGQIRLRITIPAGNYEENAIFPHAIHALQACVEQYGEAGAVEA